MHAAAAGLRNIVETIDSDGKEDVKLPKET